MSNTIQKLTAASQKKATSSAKFQELHTALNSLSSRLVPADEYTKSAMGELTRQAAAINEAAMKKVAGSAGAKSHQRVVSAGGINGNGQPKLRTSTPEGVDFLRAGSDFGKDIAGSPLALMLAVGAVSEETLANWLRGLAVASGCPSNSALSADEIAAESVTLSERLKAAIDEFNDASALVRDLSAQLALEAASGPASMPEPVAPVVSAPVAQKNERTFIDAS